MSRDSTAKVLTVAFLLCLVCAVLVSAAAVGLSSRQERNRIEEKRKNILQAAGLYEAGRSIDEQFRKIQPRIVDLQADRVLVEERVQQYFPGAAHGLIPSFCSAARNGR